MYIRLFNSELEAMAQCKLSASAILVYTVLCKFDIGKTGKVFPSIQTIGNHLEGQYSRSSIEKAIQHLVKHKLIIRGRKTSKDRFTLPLRIEAYETYQNRNLNPENVTGLGQKNPEDVTVETRNILREKKIKHELDPLFIKGKISEIDIAFGKFPKNRTWERNFLSSIRKIIKNRKALTKEQSYKLEQVLTNSKRFAIAKPHAEPKKGGQGSLCSNSANPDHLEEHLGLAKIQMRLQSNHDRISQMDTRLLSAQEQMDLKTYQACEKHLKEVSFNSDQLANIDEELRKFILSRNK